MPTQSNEFRTRLRQLRNHYIAQLPAKRDTIMATLNAIMSDPRNQQNIEDLRFIVHTLAGSGGSFGLHALSNKARALDVFLKNLLLNEQLDITDKQLAEISNLVSEVLSIPTEGLDDDILDLAQDIDIDAAAISERILVIDDDNNTVNIIRKAGVKHVCQLGPSVGHDTIIKTIREFRPGSIFVSCLAMQEETETCQTIHALQQSGIEIPVFYLAEDEDMASFFSGSSGEATRCLVKPLDLAQIQQLALSREYPGAGAPGEMETPQPEVAGGREKRQGNKATILYIEDNPANSKFVTMIVAAKSGHELVVRDSAEAALEYLEISTPDLILLDINLPGMDGYSAYRLIRDRPALARVPIIALSGNACQTDKQRAKQVGFDAYLTKPINIGELLDTINAYILVE